MATPPRARYTSWSTCTDSDPAVSHLTCVLAVYEAYLKALVAVQTMCIDGKVGTGPLWKKLSVERVLVHYTALVGIADAKPSNKVAEPEVQAESKPGIVPEKNSDKRVREHCLEILAELQKALENADRCGCVGKPLDIAREEAASARWKGTFYEEVTLEEKKAIFQAMSADVDSGVGSFGHAYTIGECGGGMETSRCPECHEPVGGRSHQLDASNQAASSFLREVNGPAPQNAWRENAAVDPRASSRLVACCCSGCTSVLLRRCEGEESALSAD